MPIYLEVFRGEVSKGNINVLTELKISKCHKGKLCFCIYLFIYLTTNFLWVPIILLNKIKALF